MLRAPTGEEEAKWSVAVVAGLAALGSWPLDLHLGKRVKPRIFSLLFLGERPCPSKGVLNMRLREF